MNSFLQCAKNEQNNRTVKLYIFGPLIFNKLSNCQRFKKWGGYFHVDLNSSFGFLCTENILFFYSVVSRINFFIHYLLICAKSSKYQNNLRNHFVPTPSLASWLFIKNNNESTKDHHKCTYFLGILTPCCTELCEILASTSSALRKLVSTGTLAAVTKNTHRFFSSWDLARGAGEWPPCPPLIFSFFTVTLHARCNYFRTK